MKIELTQIYGFESAIRGMRNPLDSWHLSDSIGVRSNNFNYSAYDGLDLKNLNPEGFVLGKKDQTLSRKLTKAGTEHCKHLRMIQVWVDLTLPRYIWAELDTYRNLEKISCSTMHTLMKKTLIPEMFEDGWTYLSEEHLTTMCEYIEEYKTATTNEDKKRYKYRVKSLLPESFLQKRTVNTNYMTLLNMFKQRKNHELPQWQEICSWILKLPFFTELTGVLENSEVSI